MTTIDLARRWRPVRSNKGLCDDLFIFGVRTDPNPVHTAVGLNRESPIMSAHPNRPQLADFLKMEGRMPRIRFEEFVVLVGKFTDFGR